MGNELESWESGIVNLVEQRSSCKGTDGEAIVDFFSKRPFRSNDLSWLDQFAAFITAKTWEEDAACIRGLLNGIAWRDRSHSNGIEWNDNYLQLSLDNLADRCQIYYLGTRLRYDFRFQTLGKASEAWLANSASVPDSLLFAFRAFSLLQSNLDEGLEFITRALHSSNSNRNTRLVCLQALWIAPFFPEQPDRMLEVVRLMQDKGEALGAGANYWISKAYRLKHEWEKAYDCMDRAFETLEPGSDFISIHQDFAREREQITAQKLLHAEMEVFHQDVDKSLGKQLDDAKRELGKETRQAEGRIAESIFNIVTIIGVFIAIIGVVAASGAIVLKSSRPLWQNIILLAVAGLIGLGFIVTLRSIVSSGVHKKSRH
jgi:tetratricopeptide (TPR) repeat protein